MAIASLILGILSIIVEFLALRYGSTELYVFIGATGIFAIIFGSIALKKNNLVKSQKKIAKIAIILGIIPIVISGGIGLLYFLMFQSGSLI